jgi:death-on-curing protein
MKWHWVHEDVVLAIHEAQLAEHGGPVGIRDSGLLSSALARPQQLHAYGVSPDAPALAAAYAHGIARNHPFLDGNKRTAFVVLELFLELNGWSLQADDADCVTTIQELASGKLSERELSSWVRSHIKRI